VPAEPVKDFGSIQPLCGPLVRTERCWFDAVVEEHDRSGAEARRDTSHDLVGRDVEPVIALRAPSHDLEAGAPRGEERANVLPSVWWTEQPHPLSQDRFETSLPRPDVTDLASRRASNQRRDIVISGYRAARDAKRKNVACA
jgi:hypothetical protein